MKTKKNSFQTISLLLILLGVIYTPVGLSAQETEYIVINTQDSGEGSFRKALNDADANTGTAIIRFNIPKTDPGFNADTGVWTIAPTSPLSGVTGNHIIINGLSQSEFIGEDSNPYGPEIVITGRNAGYATGFYAVAGSIEFIHLILNRFGDAAIFLSSVHHAVIAGCYIGTGPDGWENKGNGMGIFTKRCKNVHIVPLDTVPNIIGGNENGGITFHDTSTHNLVTGNIIGLTRDHQEVIGETSGHGIEFWNDCDSNTVVDNWIGGNVVGVGIYDSHDNTITGNRIGTDPEWTQDFGNSWDGIEIMQGSKGNIIMGNHIGNNSRDGVRVYGSETMYNTITENSISENVWEGISLMLGANGGLTAPKITTVMENELFGTAPPNSIIEIYTDKSNEGRIIQGVVISDSAGNFGWVGAIQGTYDSITATATDTLGNTSEFGRYKKVDDPTSIERISEPILFVLSNNFPNPDQPEVQIIFNLPVSTEVKLDVYNLSGIKIYEIHNGKLPTGHQSLSWNTSRHASGIYLIRMQTRRVL